MSIELPPELGWVAKLAVGQDWPKGDEDKLRSLGAAWDDAARQLTAISREIDPATSGVLHSVGGQVADEFTAFTQQLKSNIPDMADAAGQLGELGRNTGLQVEYAKYMIIAQLVWLAVEIAELAFWAPEAIPALVTGVRLIVKMLLKRLLISIATGVGFMVGMDAVIQGIQFLKGDRTKWDTAATLQALEGGAIGGAIGGLFSGAGSAFAPKFASSLIGKGIIGGASSIVTTEVMSEIFGGENDMGSALTSGIIGAMGGGGGKRRFGGGEHTEVHTPDIHLPSEPDLHLPKLSLDADGPHLPGAEGFDTKGAGSGLGEKGAGTGSGTGSVTSLNTGGTRTGDETGHVGDSTAHTAPHTTVTESEGPVTGATQKTTTAPHVATESTGSTRTTGSDRSAETHLSTGSDRSAESHLSTGTNRPTETHLTTGSDRSTETDLSAGANRPAETTRSTSSTTPTTSTTPTGTTRSTGPTTSTNPTGATTPHRSPTTDYGQDEVAPRAPRAQAPTGQNQAPATGGQNGAPTTGGQHPTPTTGGQHPTPTTGGQNQSPSTAAPHPSPTSAAPHQSPTTEHSPAFPDVPRHEPGTAPHVDTESTAPDTHVTEQLHQLDSIAVPTHDPNPLHQAPTPPTNRPVAPDAGIRQRVSDLDRAARSAGMSEADRSAYTRAVEQAAASGDWQRAGEHLSDFRTHVETRTVQQRYDAFHAHAQGGFDRLTDFTGSRQEWQSKVDAVEQAHRSGDSELLDSRLNEYSSYVENHVPSGSLTGNDTPRPFHQDVEDLRQRLALTTDQPTADRLRAQLDSTRQDAELHDRLVQLRSTSDPETTALYERLDNARTPDEANQALHDLEQHREDQRLQQRLDHLKSDEPTPDRPPTPGSEADLRRRMDALNDGADEHERELRERVDQAATPQDADRALRDLHEYRTDQRLQQRLDRLKSDTPDRPSERELRERLEALHDGEDDPRAAELRRRAQEAGTEQEARAALERLDQHLHRRESDRQDRMRELGDRLEQAREQHTEQLLGIREGAPEDTFRRIEDIRTELSSHLTYDERTSGLRQELTRPAVTPESPGHLDRITTKADEHPKTTEDTTPRPAGDDALKAPADHTPSTGSASSADHRTTPAPGPQHPAQQPHEQPRHQQQGDQQLQARKEPSQEDPDHPSRQPVPSAEGLDDLRRPAGASGPSGPPPRMRLDRTPRYVVRSGFDQRRFTVGETSYTDLTVRVALRDDGSGAHDADDTWSRAQEGVRRYFNDPRYTLPNGDRLHVTLERVGPDDKPHLTVDVVGAGHDMDQRSWAPGARPVEYAHEISHQLGLRDEYADETAPQRPHIPGSLPGDVHRAPEHDELPHGGLRDRHIQLLGALTTGHDDLLAQRGGGHHPRHEDTGDGSVWRQARAEAPAVPRQHAWVDPVSDPTRQPEPKPGEVDAHAARETYGMPEKNFKGFRQIAREKNLVIDVRPTNPTAPKWLDAGAMAKPQAIKAKTINEADVHLGADPKTIGLVGYFKPQTPDRATVPDGDWDKVLSRYNQRSTEYRELNAKMAVYEAEHKFAVKDGVVYGIDSEGRQRPITGDHDLFDISTPGGTRVPHPQHDELIKEMQAKDIAVMHGAHMFWDPPSPFSKTVFDKIVDSHQGPDGEPLLRFRPENKHAELTWTKPLKDGEVNSYTARHTYGIPEKNFKGFRQIAREKNLVIDVRPTNSTAPKWLDAGAMAKPQDIKAKTISEADTHLGADPKNIGLVGYFKPRTPDQATVPGKDWDKVLSRYNQRSTEYRELNAKMELLAKKNKFVVVDGVVHGVGEDGVRRPITGDHDLFDISTPGGTRIPPKEHEALIKEMQAKDIAVMHGAHMFWDPPSPFSKSVFDKIVDAHHGPDGEPLLRFRPGHENAELTWTEKPQEHPKEHEQPKDQEQLKTEEEPKDQEQLKDGEQPKEQEQPESQEEEKPQETPEPQEKEPDAVLDGRHIQGLAGKKITEDPGPDAVRTRVETLLGGHSGDTSVAQRLDAALDPANFRKQHGQMVNGGWRFTVHVDGKPYEVEVKASASAWQLDPTKDAAKDNDGDGFDVPVESTHESAPRKTEMTSSEAGLEFGPTIVRPVNPQLSALVTPSGKLGGATHGRETTVKSSAQTANQFAFTGKTDSYTSDFAYRVKVTDHQGTRLAAPGADGEIKGQVRADVPRPQELDKDRPRAWQGWESDRARNHAERPASGHPVSVTGLDTARDAVYEALPREARPDGTAHQDIEDFFQPSNVINEFEHASGAGLLSKPLTLSDGGKAHLLLTVEPDDSRALHTVDDKATLGSKSSGEHGQSRTENSSWSLGLSGGATGEVWKATDGSKESTWLTGTAGYTGSGNLAHGVKGKNTIGSEASREQKGKADLVATQVRLRVQLIRHHFGPGLDGLHSTSTTKIGDHSPPPSVKQPAPAPGDVVLTIDPQNGEVLRAVPHELPPVTTGDHAQLEPARLTDPVAAPRTTILDVPGSTELEDHIVREMHRDHPGVLPPPEAVRPGTAAGNHPVDHPRVTPEAWENLRSLRQQLAPSRLRGGGAKLLDGTYRITLKSPHLPGRSGTTHEVLIKAEPGKGDHLGSGKSTTKAAHARTTGADKSVTRSAKHVVNLAGNVRSSLDHPDVTRGFTIGSLDITAHNPSHGLTMGTETEVKRQFSLEADTDTYGHPVTYHVMIGVEDPKQPTTHLSTIAPSPHLQHIKQVQPGGHLTVEVARPREGNDSPPPASIPKVEVLPQRHAVRHVTASDAFRDTARQSLTSAFQKKSAAAAHARVPELKDALDGLTDEDHLRSLVSASHGGWANSGDEQVGSGRNRDTVGLSTRTELSNLRFRETLPGEGKLEIETKSSVSTAVADKNTRAFKAGLGFDAARFPSKDSPDASLQVRGGVKGKGGAGQNSGENIKQKMTTSRKAAYKGTWHLYEADADVTVQGRVTDAKGQITLGDPQHSGHRVLVLLSDDDVRRLGADTSKAPDTTGTRQAPLLAEGLLGGGTAEIPRSDEILGEIDRQIRGLDQVSDVPESALPFADTFSPENLSANYEDLVGRGILDYHVQESRTQRVITEVLVRGVPRDEWADEGDHSTGDTTRKVGLSETVKGSAGHNWSLGADGNFRISYAPVVKPKPGEDAAAVKAEESKSGLGNVAWAPSGGAEGTRSKSAESGVTTKVEHKTSKFGDTVRFGNRMRFEVTVTRRTEYGRFVNLAKPRPVEPTWRVHVDVPKSLTETAEQAATHQQDQQKQQPPKAQQQVLDGGGTVEMRPVVPKADRDRWQASLDSAHDLVGFDHHAGLYDQAQTVLTTPRPWGDGVLGKTGAALSWGLGSAASTVGHWAGAMTPEAATKLLGSFVADPRLDASHPLVSEQRLPLEQQFSLRRALGSGTLPTVFHQLKDPAHGYRTVPLGSDGRTGVEVRMEPTGDAVEISTRDDGSDEITVSTEHESATTASNGLTANLTPLAVPVTTKNPSVVVPMPTNALKLDRDQTFESDSPVTRAPGVPARTLAPPVLPHGKTATEPGKATVKGAQVLMRQPVRLSTQKYDENGTYGNTAHTDGHVYYWTAKKTEDASTSTTTATSTSSSTSTDTTAPKDATPSKDTVTSTEPTPAKDATTTTDTTPAKDATTDTKPVKAPGETGQQDTTHKPAETQKPVDTHDPADTHKPAESHETTKPADAHQTTKPVDSQETTKPAEDHTAEAPPQPRVPVPGDGRCLLYSVLASTPPEHWPSALHGGTTDHARARHGAVVHQIRTQRGRVGADSPLGRAARDLHQMVLDRVQNSRPRDLSFDVTELYRRTQENQLRQTLRTESFEQLRQRLHDAGVDHVVSHDWLSPQALRTLYVDTRAQELTGPPHQLSAQDAADRAAAEVPETTDEQGRWKLRDSALAPRAQFAYLTTRSGPLSLDYVDSHDRLAGAVVDTALHQPLSPAEHRALIRAVQNWVPGNDAWNTDEGEMFPGLVAHTLGVQLRTFQSTGAGTAHLRTVGPEGGDRTVDVYYNGRNHYDASRTPTHPADQGTTTVPPKAKPPMPDEAAPKAPKAPAATTTHNATATTTHNAATATAPPVTAPRRPLDHAPRFVVRSAFDARAFRVGDTKVTDLTVRVAFRDGSGHDPDTAWQRLRQGAEEFYNRPGHRLPDGSLLHVTVERVPVGLDPHLVVDLAGHDRPMDQRTWWPDAEPVAYAHELGHQLGLRDEYREDDEGPGRAQVAGSLLGDFHRPAPHGLAQGGLRGRHLQLLGALVGDVPESVVHSGGEQSHTTPSERDPRWQQARTDAEPVTRRHVWVDPVTDPRHDSAEEEHTAQDPRMPQSENSQEHREEEEDWSDILQEYTAERRHEYEWLDGLYGETLDQESYDRAHDALLTLQSMDLAHPAPDAEHRPHLELLAGQVLHLDEAPSADDYRYLLALTAHAGPESTRDAAALAAHFLATEHGALDHHTALVDSSGQATGRDWTGTRAVPPDLTSYTVSGPGGESTEHEAPWREPYVVTALGTPGDGLFLQVDGRTIRVSGPAEFAELVARDPLRGPDQDILLLVSHAQDQGLAQLVADRSHAAVWSTGAEVRPTLDWRTGTERLDLSGGDGAWSLHLGGARGPLDLFDDLFDPSSPEHDPGGPDYAAKLVPHPGGDTSPLTPANLLDRLRARPLTTSDYEVTGAEPGTTLFAQPTSMEQTGFRYDRSGSGDVPRLIVPTQGRHQTLVSEHPPLHVSGDLSLAHRQGGYGQQVFASPKAIESANHRLALAGSLVRLKGDEVKLRVGDGQGGHRELVRVTPQFLTRSGKSEEEICRDFAQMVSGNVAASHVVFRGPDGTGLAKAPINALGRTEVTGIHHLAESLTVVADGQRPAALDPSWAARQVGRDDRFIAESDGPTPGKSYGSALSYDPLDNPRRDNLSAAAREIGINEHAWAKVGEAYLVHSINALDADGLPSLAHNYAKPGEPDHSHFGYHFAAVVLASEDGRHQITLENFARRAHVAAIVKSAVARNLRHATPDGFHKLHEAIGDELDSARTGAADEARVKRLERHLALADALAKAVDARAARDATAEGSPEGVAADAAYDKAVKVAEARMKQASELTKGSELWHFRMFSQRPGETMHEVSADLLTNNPSAEANPLTSVIVHGHRLPQVDIGFREGSRQISRDEGRKLNYVAELATRTGLWNHHNGLPLPRITVTGRGNARRPTLGGVLPEAARQRAEAVHGELRDRLDRYLINYQHGVAQRRLTAADFPVAVSTEHPAPGGDREQGRVTTVAVHDHRPEDTTAGTTTTPHAASSSSPSASSSAEAAPRAPRAPRTEHRPAEQPQRPPARPHHPAAEPVSAPAPTPAPSSSYRSERLTIGGVEFADGSVELAGAQRETVHRLAAEVAWAAVANTRAGFPPPRVVVVGHAHGMRGGLPHFGEALRRGQARADGVAEVFRSALAVHLARLQDDGEGVTLLADIEVTTRSEGNAPPPGAPSDPDPGAALRQAFVVVELPRPEGGDAR
ncbi:hypothetical protein GTY81_30045 [Streptomyces sp. SID8366]|uniref:WXG100-like domain-containing protein n=3 Tax=Streptomyces TaxID=1883 RepID=UPI000DBA99B6|nr:hypothetical protein [Streptomyces sp. PsTaAH-130]MYU08039.1 hypothetical protein [Streptomyces sp. SID8366]RAJ59233.1 hypothetical protein K376_02994 [Streptomyces sp. PsTaAH-130]